MVGLVVGGLCFWACESVARIITRCDRRVRQPNSGQLRELLTDESKRNWPAKVLATNLEATCCAFGLKATEQLLDKPKSNRTRAVVGDESAATLAGLSLELHPVPARPCERERLRKSRERGASHRWLGEDPKFIPRVGAAEAARSGDGKVGHALHGLEQVLSDDARLRMQVREVGDVLAADAIPRGERTCVAKERAQEARAVFFPRARK